MTKRISALLLLSLLWLMPFPARAASPSAALQLLSAGHADEAMAALRLHLRAAPQDAAAHALLMRTFIAVQLWDDAIAEGRQAIALDPQNSLYHLWLGRAYGEKAEHSLWVTAVGLARKTRIEFETAVALDRGNLEAHADLAEFYVEAPSFLGGGGDKALAQADQLHSLGDETSSLAIRARVAESAGNYSLAEQQLRSAIYARQNNPDAILALAGFLQRRARMTEVESAVNQAVAGATGSNSGHVFLEGATLLYKAGRNFNGAIQMLHTYIASGQYTEDAPLFQAYYLLGSILEKSGDRQAAALQYRAALALANGFEPAQTALKRVQ
jgi:Tfp pilus assembly protein PilF